MGDLLAASHQHDDLRGCSVDPCDMRQYGIEISKVDGRVCRDADGVRGEGAQGEVGVRVIIRDRAHLMSGSRQVARARSDSRSNREEYIKAKEPSWLILSFHSQFQKSTLDHIHATSITLAHSKMKSVLALSALAGAIAGPINLAAQLAPRELKDKQSYITIHESCNVTQRRMLEKAFK